MAKVKQPKKVNEPKLPKVPRSCLRTRQKRRSEKRP